MASKKGKKAEKQKTPEVVQVEEQPAEKELVQGKGFYESDWVQMLQKEDDILFICGLVEEIFEKACVVVVHQATEKETYSFSVQWAKKVLVEKIESFFLESDVGELNVSPDYKLNMMEDVEPSVPIIDSWARGVVPMARASDHQEAKDDCVFDDNLERSLSEHDSHNSENSDELPLTQSPIQSKSSSYSNHNRPRKYLPINQVMKVISPPLLDNEKEASHNESISTTSHTPFSSTAFINIPPLVSGVNTKLQRPHKHSEVFTDQHNRITETVHLDSRKFPSPSTKPVVSLQKVPDPVQRITFNTMFNSNTGLKPSIANKMFPTKRTSSINHEKKRSGCFGGINRIDSHRVPKDPILPPFLDVIDPLPGVTVYENGQSLTGYTSPRNKLWSPVSKLKPISPFRKRIHRSESRRSRQSDPSKLDLSSSVKTSPKLYTLLNAT